MKPVAHRFAYRRLLPAVDLDRLDEAVAASRLFSVNAAATSSASTSATTVRATARRLRAYVDRLLATDGRRSAGRPRAAACAIRASWGTVFNPLSVYFAYRPDGTLAAVHLRGAQHVRRKAQLCRARGGRRAVAGRPAAEPPTSSSTSRPSTGWRWLPFPPSPADGATSPSAFLRRMPKARCSRRDVPWRSSGP